MIPPIIIISYNNYKYVENTVNQLLQINEEYFQHIQILDNCSSCSDTIQYLKNVNCKVIYNNTNSGPGITSNNNAHIYNYLPDKFIITDPDLEFNANLPNNFIEILINLSDKYNCNKIGFALDISDFDKMYEFKYHDGKNIYDWEIQFWKHKITNSDDEYELYNAAIDTTFCLVNKNKSDKNIRIAGNFTAKHLPWYKNHKVYNVYENYVANINTTDISTISRLVKSYIASNYLKITKNDEFFLIENKTEDDNLTFWKNIYTNWENETFQIFDTFLNKNTIFIDIGSWIGTTCMYASRKSKYVYCVEADTTSFNYMSQNCKINCKNNYTLINKAIYNIDNVEIKFGKNRFLHDSTSQMYVDEEISDECYIIQTITLQSIIENNNINPNEISLIKVDIEGGEEYILNDLYNIHKQYNTPLYIRFHYDWWKDKNLERFEFLTENHKQSIINNPFISILFLALFVRI